MTTTPDLRDLAQQIEDLGRAHPCWSQAHEMIRGLTEYLRARARIEDINRNDAMEGKQRLTFEYTNYRGEVSQRYVRVNSIRWGTSQWYPQPTWLLTAWDQDKMDFREFNLASMRAITTLSSR